MEMDEKVLNVIEKIINPKLLEHEGWVELVKTEDNIVHVRFRGACSGCGANYNTLDTVIKPTLLEHVKEVKGVEIVSEVSEELLDLARSILGGKQ